MKKRLLIILLVLLIGGCASTPYNHINPAAKTHLDSVDAYLVVSQDEIYAQIEQSNLAVAAGGGLLFALVDALIESSRAKSAEKNVSSLRDNLIDIDYAQQLADQINTRLKEVTWLHSNDVILERSQVSKEGLADMTKDSSASAVMIMVADYSLSPKFDAISTSIRVMMYPNKDDLAEYKERNDKNDNPFDDADNIYRNTISFSKPLAVTGEKKEEVVSQLAENDSQMLKDALAESAQKIAEMLYQDLSIEQTASAK